MPGIDEAAILMADIIYRLLLSIPVWASVIAGATAIVTLVSCRRLSYLGWRLLGRLTEIIVTLSLVLPMLCIGLVFVSLSADFAGTITKRVGLDFVIPWLIGMAVGGIGLAIWRHRQMAGD